MTLGEADVVFLIVVAVLRSMVMVMSLSRSYTAYSVVSQNLKKNDITIRGIDGDLGQEERPSLMS